MKCKIDGCTKDVMYKERQLCQMHYFRHMRNGTYDKTRKPEYSIISPNGYVKTYNPDHPLSDKQGRTYEHRRILYESIGEGPHKCELCGKAWSWRPYKDHVDHIDGDKENNDLSNLRPLCNGCNTQRGRKPAHEDKGRVAIEIDGIKMTAAEWARAEGVLVAGATILNRIKRGWGSKEAVYSPPLTGKNKRQLENQK
jgi:hypothetical protein